jgi:hypothetical protein
MLSTPLLSTLDTKAFGSSVGLQSSPFIFQRFALTQSFLFRQYRSWLLIDARR